MILEWVRLFFAALFLLAGLGMIISAVLGVFRFNYVMNRMHIAATADTLGLMLLVVGLCILSGFNVMTAKFVLIILFFWLGSPVSSHMIAEIEIVTNHEADKEFEVTKP